MLAPPQQCVTRPTLENFPRPLGVRDLMMAERRRRTPEGSDRPPEADLRCLLPSLEVHDHTDLSSSPRGRGNAVLCVFFLVKSIPGSSIGLTRIPFFSSRALRRTLVGSPR